MRIAPLTLEGTWVRLAPLSLDHLDSLCTIGLDPVLWQKTTIRVETTADMLRYVETALEAQAAGTALPFVIEQRETGHIVGSTRYHSIAPQHRRLEIGFSWVAPPWQRTAVNTEAKYLLLAQAFEQFGCQRVEFKVDSDNEPSRQALLRIGAKLEGTLRNYMLSAHRGARDIAVFSILDSEWPQVKAALEHKLDPELRPT